MVSLLKKFTGFFYIKNCFAKKSLTLSRCQNIVSVDVDCVFFPLEILAQIDYVTMQHMAHMDVRKCSAN